MGNRASIEVFERKNLRNNGIDYCISIYDDYDETTLFVAREDIPDDDLELLKKLIEFKHQEDVFGGGSCRVIEDVLDYIEKHQNGIYVGNTYFSYEEIKEVLDHDIRTVFYCPKCGWESYNEEDCNVFCLRDGCDGEMSEQREEWYKK